MRLKLYSLLLICTTLLLGTSFQSCNNSPTKSKKTSKKAVSNKKMLPAADFWVAAKDNLGLTSKQINGIKGINGKYDKKISSLKKTKKWDGKANIKVRKSTFASKTNELKKLLGKKYPMYQKFLAKNAIKPVKRKKSNKSTKGSKKKSNKSASGKKKKTPIKKK